MIIKEISMIKKKVIYSFNLNIYKVFIAKRIIRQMLKKYFFLLINEIHLSI